MRVRRQHYVLWYKERFSKKIRLWVSGADEPYKAKPGIGGRRRRNRRARQIMREAQKERL